MVSVFALVVHLGMYMFLVFAALAFAAGLFYLAELAEEWPTYTSRIIRVTIYIVSALHVLLFATGDVPAAVAVTGIVTHLTYSVLLKRFPDVVLVSPGLIGSVVLFLLDNLVWTYIMDWGYVELPHILSVSFLLIWLVPLAFFVSLALGDSVLPTFGTASKEKSSPWKVSAKSLFKCCRRKDVDDLPAHAFRNDNYGNAHPNPSAASSSYPQASIPNYGAPPPTHAHDSYETQHLDNPDPLQRLQPVPSMRSRSQPSKPWQGQQVPQHPSQTTPHMGQAFPPSFSSIASSFGRAPISKRSD